MLGRTTTLEVRTAEGVSFKIPIASPCSRCLALAVDLGMIMGLTILATFVLNILQSMASALPGIGRILVDFGQGTAIIVQFIIATFYGILLEWLWSGQTLGKRLLRLRVIDERGLSLSFKQIAIRNIFRLLDMLPSTFYLIGGTSCLFTAKCQRTGDIAAGTLVIREVNVPIPSCSELLEEGENSFASTPHLEARLRQRISPEEARIALDAITRRDELKPESRLLLFARLADHFRTLSEFPDEITVGLSDEQYVRNVVDTLFRRASI